MKNNLYILGFLVALVSVVLVGVYQWSAPQYTYKVSPKGLKIYSGLLRTVVVSERGEFEATSKVHSDFIAYGVFMVKTIKSVTLREKGFIKEVVNFEFE